MAEMRHSDKETATMRLMHDRGDGAQRARRGRLVTLAAVAALGLATFGCLAPSAGATEPIENFEVVTSTTQAGGHPDLTTAIELANPGNPEAAQNLIVNLPQGVFGNPQAITTCRAVDFARSACPVASQAGLVSLRANYSGNPNYVLGTAPVFDMEAGSDGETARFAFIVPGLNIPISIPVAVRTAGDYGLRMTVAGITQQIPLAYASLTLWGFPAAEEHDPERFGLGAPGEPAGCVGIGNASCNVTTPHSAGIPVHPLTDNPTVCTGQPLTVSLDVQTYQDPGNRSHADASYPKTEGCEQEVFNPVLNMDLTSDETDAPSGLDIQLNAPQFESFAFSPSEIRSAQLELPEGISINPDAADGQTACTDAEANFDSEGPASCPDNSKIGNFDIQTPALTGPLNGSLYFGEPKPGDQYRVFMVADGFGIHAKLVASVRPDPQTGQLTMVVDDLPQVPFDRFNLHLFSSQRGIVATPTQCTIYTADSLFVPWNDQLASQHSRPVLSLTSGPNGRACPGPLRPFHPRLAAGTSNPTAGASSSFSLKLDRDDGDQFLNELNFTMPPGLTGSLRGITYCPEADIAAAARKLGREELASPSCPATSEIGTTNVAAGPGTHPFHAVGKMYLAGPLDGQPLSLAAITPALAGPYDYGTVVVRVAIGVDPRDAHVIALSDPMPQIIGGVPIRMRSIQVNIDKPNFMINPTNCSPFTVDSQGIGDQGTVASFSSYFHVANCATLRFKPKMTIRQLGSRKQTRRSQDPRLRFDLWSRRGDANLKSVAVTLPKAFAVDQRHLGNICSKAELAATRCAGRAAIGTVSTDTPLLEAPLKGLAYAVSGYGKLPHLAFILAGQVTIVPEAESSSVKGGHLKTVVPVIPDAPIGHFRLTLYGGKKGYITNTRSLCGSPAVTVVEYRAQNGKRLTKKVKLKTPCPRAKKRKAHRRAVAR
jgi:hypothetical protein